MSINLVSTCKHDKRSMNVIYNQYPLQHLGMGDGCVVFRLLRKIAHLKFILLFQLREIHFKKRAKRDAKSTVCFLNNFQVKRCFYNHVL